MHNMLYAFAYVFALFATASITHNVEAAFGRLHNGGRVAVVESIMGDAEATNITKT